MTRAKRTDPDLWEKVKAEVTRSDKGGKPGQWSARKAQLSVQRYKKLGGGYVGGKSRTNSLRQWTEEDWGTRSQKPSGETGERYLPRKARENLSDEEYRRTTARKRADGARGRQYSPQPRDIAEKTAKYRHGAADRAHQAARPTKSELMKAARGFGVAGRTKMSREDLENAVAEAEVRQEKPGNTKAVLEKAAAKLAIAGRSGKGKRELPAAVAQTMRDGADAEFHKDDLEEVARTLGVHARPSMTKAELREAILALTD